MGAAIVGDVDELLCNCVLAKLAGEPPAVGRGVVGEPAQRSGGESGIARIGSRAEEVFQAVVEPVEIGIVIETGQTVGNCVTVDPIGEGVAAARDHADPHVSRTAPRFSVDVDRIGEPATAAHR